MLSSFFGQQPTAIVVDSSLWDVTSWWLQAGKPAEPFVAPHARVAQWCQNDFPALADSVQAVAPTSKVAFRTVPQLKFAPGHGQSEQNVEAMNACLRDEKKPSDLKKYTMIDYAADVQTLVESLNTARSAVYEDDFHPGMVPSVLYIDRVLQWVNSISASKVKL